MPDSDDMKKYEPIQKYLESLPPTTDEITLSFEQLEQIIGVPLPFSATEYREFWSNQVKGSRSSYWIAAGFIADNIDLKQKTIYFIRHKEVNERSNSATSEHVDAHQKDWTRDELKASVEAYLDMFRKKLASQPFVKAEYYRRLSDRFKRTEKSFEYRMQNISFVLSVMGRNWLPGLVPAQNVGSRVASELEELIAEVEGKKFEDAVEFKVKVQEASRKRQTSLPIGNAAPSAHDSTVCRYDRDALVVAWILRNAADKCELCDQIAPFKKPDGNLYLEVHHVVHLVNDGPDTIQNAVALCPNCHKRLHYGVDAGELAESLYEKINRLTR